MTNISDTRIAGVTPDLSAEAIAGAATYSPSFLYNVMDDMSTAKLDSQSIGSKSSHTSLASQTQINKAAILSRGYVLNDAQTQQALSSLVESVDVSLNQYFEEVMGLGRSVSTVVSDTVGFINESLLHLDALSAVDQIQSKLGTELSTISSASVEGKLLNQIDILVKQAIAALHPVEAPTVSADVVLVAYDSTFDGRRSWTEAVPHVIADQRLSQAEQALNAARPSSGDSLQTETMPDLASGPVAQTGGYNSAFAFDGSDIHNVKDYIQPDDPAVVSLILDLRSQGVLRQDMTEDQMIFAIEGYVATHFRYESDSVTGSAWKEVSKTLQDGSGDCEDLTNLLASLCIRAGVRADRLEVLVDAGSRTEQGHVVMGVKDQQGNLRLIDPSQDIQAHGASKTLAEAKIVSRSDYDFSYTQTTIFSADGSKGHDFGTFEDPVDAQSSYTAGDFPLPSIALSVGDVSSPEPITMESLGWEPTKFVYKGTSSFWEAMYHIANAINMADFNFRCSISAMLNQGISPQSIVDLLNSIRETVANGGMTATQGQKLMKSFSSGAGAGTLLDALKNPKGLEGILNGAWGPIKDEAKADPTKAPADFIAAKLGELGIMDADSLGSDGNYIDDILTITPIAGDPITTGWTVSVDANVTAWANSLPKDEFKSWNTDFTNADFQALVNADPSLAISISGDKFPQYTAQFSDANFGGASYKTLNVDAIRATVKKLNGSIIEATAVAMIGQALGEITNLVQQIIFGVAASKSEVFTAKRLAESMNATISGMEKIISGVISDLQDFNTNVSSLKTEAAKTIAAAESSKHKKNGDAYEQLVMATFNIVNLQIMKATQVSLNQGFNDAVMAQISELASGDSFSQARAKVISEAKVNIESKLVGQLTGTKKDAEVMKEFSLEMTGKLNSIKMSEQAFYMAETAVESVRSLILKLLYNIDSSFDMKDTLSQILDTVRSTDNIWLTQYLQGLDIMRQIDNAVIDAKKDYDAALDVVKKIEATSWLSGLISIFQFLVVIITVVAVTCFTMGSGTQLALMAAAAVLSAISSVAAYYQQSQILKAYERGLLVDRAFKIETLTQRFIKLLTEMEEKEKADQVSLEKKMADELSRTVKSMWTLVSMMGGADLWKDKDGGFKSVDATAIAHLRQKIMGLQYTMLAIIMLMDSLSDVNDIVMRVSFGVSTKLSAMGSMQAAVSALFEQIQDASNFQTGQLYAQVQEHNRAIQQALDLKKVQDALSSAFKSMILSVVLSVAKVAALTIPVVGVYVSAALTVLGTLADLALQKQKVNQAMEYYNHYNDWEADTQELLLDTYKTDEKRRYDSIEVQAANTITALAGRITNSINAINFDNATIATSKDFKAVNPVAFSKASADMATMLSAIIAVMTAFKSAGDVRQLVISLSFGVSYGSGFQTVISGVRSLNSKIMADFQLRSQQITLDVSFYNRKMQAENDLKDAQAAFNVALQHGLINIVLSVASVVVQGMSGSTAASQADAAFKQAVIRVLEVVNSMVQSARTLDLQREKTARHNLGDLTKVQAQLMDFFESQFSASDVEKSPIIKLIKDSLKSININNLTASTANGHIGVVSAPIAEMQYAIEKAFDLQMAIMDAHQARVEAIDSVRSMVWGTPGVAEDFGMAKTALQLWQSAVKMMMSSAQQLVSEYVKAYNSKVTAEQELKVAEAKFMVEMVMNSFKLAMACVELAFAAKDAASPSEKLNPKTEVKQFAPTQNTVRTLSALLSGNLSLIPEFIEAFVKHIIEKDIRKGFREEGGPKKAGGTTAHAARGLGLQAASLAIKRQTSELSFENETKQILDAFDKQMQELDDAFLKSIAKMVVQNALKVAKGINEFKEVQKNQANNKELVQMSTTAEASKKAAADGRAALPVPAERTTEQQVNQQVLEAKANADQEILNEAKKKQSVSAPVGPTASTARSDTSSNGADSSAEVGKALPLSPEQSKAWKDYRREKILNEIMSIDAKASAAADYLKQFQRAPRLTSLKTGQTNLAEIDQDINYSNPNMSAKQTTATLNAINAILNAPVKRTKDGETEKVKNAITGNQDDVVRDTSLLEWAVSKQFPPKESETLGKAPTGTENPLPVPLTKSSSTTTDQQLRAVANKAQKVSETNSNDAATISASQTVAAQQASAATPQQPRVGDVGATSQEAGNVSFLSQDVSKAAVVLPDKLIQSVEQTVGAAHDTLAPPTDSAKTVLMQKATQQLSEAIKNLIILDPSLSAKLSTLIPGKQKTLDLKELSDIAKTMKEAIATSTQLSETMKDSTTMALTKLQSVIDSIEMTTPKSPVASIVAKGVTSEAAKPMTPSQVAEKNAPVVEELLKLAPTVVLKYFQDKPAELTKYKELAVQYIQAMTPKVDTPALMAHVIKLVQSLSKQTNPSNPNEAANDLLDDILTPSPIPALTAKPEDQPLLIIKNMSLLAEALAQKVITVEQAKTKLPAMMTLLGQLDDGAKQSLMATIDEMSSHSNSMSKAILAPLKEMAKKQTLDPLSDNDILSAISAASSGVAMQSTIIIAPPVIIAPAKQVAGNVSFLSQDVSKASVVSPDKVIQSVAQTVGAAHDTLAPPTDSAKTVLMQKATQQLSEAIKDLIILDPSLSAKLSTLIPDTKKPLNLKELSDVAKTLKAAIKDSGLSESMKQTTTEALSSLSRVIDSIEMTTPKSPVASIVAKGITSEAAKPMTPSQVAEKNAPVVEELLKLAPAVVLKYFEDKPAELTKYKELAVQYVQAVLTVTPRLEASLRAAFPALFDKIIRETLNDQQSKSEQIRDVVWERSSIEKAPTLSQNDLTYQGLIDLIEYYKNQPTLALAHQTDILDYFSELFSASQFTGFIEPMVQFIKEHHWDTSTSWVADQMVHIPREIDSQEDFSIILKQSQLLAAIPETPSMSSWRDTIRKPIESFLKQLPSDQVPMIANQLPTWVLQLIVIDNPEKPSMVSHGRLELLIREVNKILAIRLKNEERKFVTDAIDRWVEAIQQSDPIRIKSAEVAIKIAMNKPNQTIIALLRPLNEWINSHPDMAPTYLEKMEQLSLYYQAVPTMRQLLAKIAANPSYTLSEIDRAYIRSWWPVIEPFLRDKIKENILDELRTPICSHVKKLEGLLGLSREAIIQTLQNQLGERS